MKSSYGRGYNGLKKDHASGISVQESGIVIGKARRKHTCRRGRNSDP